MSKSLVAARLYQAMANEAADDDLDVEIYDELKSYSKYFEDLCKYIRCNNESGFWIVNGCLVANCELGLT